MHSWTVPLFTEPFFYQGALGLSPSLALSDSGAFNIWVPKMHRHMSFSEWSSQGGQLSAIFWFALYRDLVRTVGLKQYSVWFKHTCSANILSESWWHPLPVWSCTIDQTTVLSKPQFPKFPNAIKELGLFLRGLYKLLLVREMISSIQSWEKAGGTYLYHLCFQVEGLQWGNIPGFFHFLSPWKKWCT